MSKSVTIIGGNVWTQRSVTWNRNVASGDADGPEADPKHDHGHHHHAHHGESPDEDLPSEWDTIKEGRGFTRRVKTS
jgi:hypothetical protein